MSDHRTLFFDLDGTLTDPKVGITTCIRYALERLGHKAPPAGELVWCIGPPLQESLATLVGAKDSRTALKYYRERFADVGWRENVPYETIQTVLDDLVSRGHLLYVATSKPWVYAEQILAHFELTSRFNGLFGAELDGTRSNKSELLAHARSRVQPSPSMTMIGDRSHDIIGGRDNGMNTIGVTYGYGTCDELRAAGADELAASPIGIASALGYPTDLKDT